MTTSPKSQTTIELKPTDLNAQGGIHCPSPLAGMKQWDTHPKVYLDVAKDGASKCPYCGTVYVVHGAVSHSH
jgi:uncharacterized Zn-finger protein